MPTDPRHLNQVFSTDSIADYLSDYVTGLKTALSHIDYGALEQAKEVIIAAAKAKKSIYAIGNGGSAAIADHLACDWTKGTAHENHETIRVHSLTANTALYSAIANDFGFETVFATQIEFYGQAGDVLIAISSSGNSPNILKAVEAAKARSITTIGLCGFTGGGLRQGADIALHLAVQNYGIVEDAHQILMHVLAQYIAKGRDDEEDNKSD